MNHRIRETGGTVWFTPRPAGHLPSAGLRQGPGQAVLPLRPVAPGRRPAPRGHDQPPLPRTSDDGRRDDRRHGRGLLLGARLGRPRRVCRRDRRRGRRHLAGRVAPHPRGHARRARDDALGAGGRVHHQPTLALLDPRRNPRRPDRVERSTRPPDPADLTPRRPRSRPPMVLPPRPATADGGASSARSGGPAPTSSRLPCGPARRPGPRGLRVVRRQRHAVQPGGDLPRPARGPRAAAPPSRLGARRPRGLRLDGGGVRGRRPGALRAPRLDRLPPRARDGRDCS